MKIAVISCAIFTQELTAAAKRSKNDCRIRFLEQGLHETPALMREKIQAAVDEIEIINAKISENDRFSAIALAYGLCSNGISGVKARSIPIIAPRTDDCIALFLGSQKRYLELFHDPGKVYWYNSAWFKQAELPCSETLAAKRSEYTEKYGKDNADYLIKTWLGSLEKYKNAIYIKSAGDRPEYTEKTRNWASHMGWDYRETEGDTSMIDRLLSGNWENEYFLTVHPACEIAESYDEGKITARPINDE